MSSRPPVLRPRRALLVLGFAAALAAPAAAAAPGEGTPAPPGEDPRGEDVVLIHGLGRSARAMRPLAQQLVEAGYRVHNLDYPSTSSAPEALVEHVHAALARCCAAAERVHFVTHSLGGIVLRAYLADRDLPALARVVMLAPPNRGSEYVDVAGDWALFEHLLGPTATQLGTGPESLPNRLPPPEFELGVIAGTGGLRWIGDTVIEGENDGTVSVASTRIEGMRDFIELDVSHTFIMRNPEVAAQVIHFLRSGCFEHEASPERAPRFAGDAQLVTSRTSCPPGAY